LVPRAWEFAPAGLAAKPHARDARKARERSGREDRAGKAARAAGRSAASIWARALSGVLLFFVVLVTTGVIYYEVNFAERQ